MDDYSVALFMLSPIGLLALAGAAWMSTQISSRLSQRAQDALSPRAVMGGLLAVFIVAAALVFTDSENDVASSWARIIMWGYGVSFAIVVIAIPIFAIFAKLAVRLKWAAVYASAAFGFCGALLLLWIDPRGLLDVHALYWLQRLSPFAGILTVSAAVFLTVVLWISKQRQ